MFIIRFPNCRHPNYLTLERVMGIEPTPPAWKAGALPLSYTRKVALLNLLIVLVSTFRLTPGQKYHVVEEVGFEPT